MTNSSTPTRQPPMVPAECKHITEAVWIEGDWRTPHKCEACILDNLNRPHDPEKMLEAFSAAGRFLDLIAGKLNLKPSNLETPNSGTANPETS